MKKIAVTIAAAAVLATLGAGQRANAGNRGTLADRWAARHATYVPWHGPYYHTSWGRPVALVVPPTANVQTDWAWGVGRSRMTPVYHQFTRPFPGNQLPDRMGRVGPTPTMPNSTKQFGVYYVRGPWWPEPPKKYPPRY